MFERYGVVSCLVKQRLIIYELHFKLDNDRVMNNAFSPVTLQTVYSLKNKNARWKIRIQVARFDELNSFFLKFKRKKILLCQTKQDLSSRKFESRRRLRL